jgi:hypothetical protein
LKTRPKQLLGTLPLVIALPVLGHFVILTVEVCSTYLVKRYSTLYPTPPHPNLTNPALPYLTLPYITLPYLTLPYLTLPYFDYHLGTYRDGYGAIRYFDLRHLVIAPKSELLAKVDVEFFFHISESFVAKSFMMIFFARPLHSAK